ncbi:MAG: chloride channel protein [Candidatus Nanopelagicales bacterium]
MSSMTGGPGPEQPDESGAPGASADVTSLPDAPMPTPAPKGPEPEVARQIAVLSVIAVGVGLLAGAGASAFVAVEHHLQRLLWDDLPEALGQDQAPAWLVVALLVSGALIAYFGSRLPGHGGHSPLAGFGIDIGPREIGSVILVGLGSLSFGAVLGPEAPLVAIGTAVGAAAVRDTGNPIRRIMMVVGAMSAIVAIFGNPLITSVLMLEMALAAGAAMATPVVLMPALAGMASSYALQVGVANWSGLGESTLGLPGLAAYPEVHLVDVAVAIPVAIVVALITMAARIGGQQVAKRAVRSPLTTILVVALATAACALAVDAITGGGLELVLFSGQSAMADYLALTSLGTATVVLVGKFIAYSLALGSGFRGGPIFPAVALGTIVATAGTLLVDGTSTAALAAAGIAAATAAALRMPFTALAMGVLLTYPAGGATTVLAIVGTIVGLVTRLAGERRTPALRTPVAHD